MPPDTNLRRREIIFHQHKLKFENSALFSVSLEVIGQAGLRSRPNIELESF